MLVGFYLLWIAFAAILFICLINIFIIAKKKQLYTVNTVLLTTLALFSITIVTVCSYDFYAKLTSEHIAAGQCEFTYKKGGNTIDTTEIIIDDTRYTIKSDFFKKIDDGIYSCEIHYLPLTKLVYELTIH